MNDPQGLTRGAHAYRVVPRVLCFILRGDRVLLQKRAGHKRLWPNMYNGLGGHLEPGEDILEGLLREIREEGGPAVENVRLRGIVTIDGGENGGVLLFLFLADARGDEVGRSEEGVLEWVPLDGVHRLPLVEDVEDLLPRLLAADREGILLFGHYAYDAAGNLRARWREGLSSTPGGTSTGG